MSLLEAIVLAIIQGVTEFLPVSSSGHLALFKQIFGLKEMGLLYDVLLHFGTLLAVFVVYHKDIIKMIAEGFGLVFDACKNIGIFFSNIVHKEKGGYINPITNSYRKFDLLIIVSTIPTGIIGLVCSDMIEMAGQLLIVPGICLIITSVLLLIADFCKGGEKRPKQVTYTNAFLIGIAQGVATLPGISRSGTTLTACLLSGFDRKFAVKYSFIMSIPAILGSVVLEISDIDIKSIPSTEIMYYVIGMLVAAAVGYVCIKTMLYVVKNKSFKIFSIYCFLIGAISIGAYFYQM